MTTNNEEIIEKLKEKVQKMKQEFEDYIRQDYAFLISIFAFFMGLIMGYFWRAI